MHGIQMIGHYSKIMTLGKRVLEKYGKNGMVGVGLGINQRGVQDKLILGRWKD